MAVQRDRGSVRLGKTRFHPDESRLVGLDGADIHLRPRSAKVLAALVARHGRIASKDDLISSAWPSPVVTDESISQCIADIRRAIGDVEHSVLETFPKRGYRLNAEVDGHRGVRGLLAAAGTLLLVGLVLFAFTSRSERAVARAVMTYGSERPSIAVLRFDEEGDALLAEGFATDLTISLAALHGVDIVPSAAALTYDPSREPLQMIAGKLGARYLVAGSLRRHGERLRIAVELVDGASGHVSWGARYDGVADDLFDFHDRTLTELTHALSLMLSDEERKRLWRRGTDDLSAYSELLLGRRAAGQLTREANFAAEKHFRRASGIAPDYARAMAHLADTYVLRLENDWSALPLEDASKARHYAERALALDADLAFAEYVLGRLLSMEPGGDLATAAFHLQRAMRLAPGDDDARVYLAVVKILGGEARRALPIIDDVIAGHPAPPFFYHLARGHALFVLGRLEAAAEALERCLWQMPTASYCLRFQIITLGAMGRVEDARWSAAEYEALGHRATVRDIMKTMMLDQEPGTGRRFRKALRTAGLPEE